MLASGLLFASQVYAAGSGTNRAGSTRRSAGKIDPKQVKEIEGRLPSAWDEARRQMREKYSWCNDGLCRLERPKISFRKGEWYDQQLGQYVVGDTDLHDNPPIQIGLTGDKDFDYETTVHEFKHFIVDSLRLGEAAHSWIDSGDDHVGGSGVHVKKAH